MAADHRRDILRLAVPAFLALVAEPLFLLADSAIVGHLGTSALAGLGVASAVLLAAANLFVFLAYGTTSVVARRVGAGDDRAAVAAGIDGIWLALVLGAVATAAVLVGTEALVGSFGAEPGAAAQATTYLRISALGLPAMLVVLAATGLLRGLQDTRTPLVVAGIGFAANAVLSLVLVHGVGAGIAGAAWGSVVAQTGMGAALVVVVAGAARRRGAPVSFRPGGVLAAARGGVPLVLRTLALRAVLVITTWHAAGLGEAELAAHQVALTVWSAAAFALDALAIAAQALTGKALGAGDRVGARAATATVVRWGVGFGVALGVLLAAGHRVIPSGFTSDDEVRTALAAALLVVAVGQPVAGAAFVLDGVLIGAGDLRWLAGMQLACLVAFLPMIGLLEVLDPVGTAGLVGLWSAFQGFMVLRAGALWARGHGDAWMVVGAAR